MKHSSPHILLINPWITDFAAYNLWIRPLGLLYICSLLRESGFRVTLIDSIDSYIKTKEYGDGKFYKRTIEKPDPIKKIPRLYSQYGIPEEMLLKKLCLIERPDLIAITSGMSYWYPGVFKIIEITKRFFKGVPIILGGIYAKLCYKHAIKYSGADIVFGSGNEFDALILISKITQFPIKDTQFSLDLLPYPAFDLYPKFDYVCISSSRGCPFRCTYCASPILFNRYMRRDPLRVVEEIQYWITSYSIKNIAFYDDALLIEPSKHFIPMMKEIIRREIHCNFHTPNALHVRGIDGEVAELLFQGGFKTIRLGLETSDEERQKETGGKVNSKEFKEGVRNLKRAGYSEKDIGVYIMAGLPGQRFEEVEETIRFVKENGARPIIVEYSPIPNTPLFEKAKKMSSFDLENEPLYHNNSIFPCQWEGFTIEDYRRLKEKVKRG